MFSNDYQSEIRAKQLYAIFSLIEKKAQMPAYEKWTNSSFEELSSIIYKETKILISATTLKRVFGKHKTPNSFYNPQAETKKAISLFLGFNNWNELINSLEIKDLKPKSKLKKKYQNQFIIFSLIFITLSIIAIMVVKPFIMSNGNSSLTCADSSFVSTIPHTVYFKYDVKDIKDSVYLLIKGQREFLPKNKNELSYFFTLPDFYRVYMEDAKKNVLQSATVHIKTNRWVKVIRYTTPQKSVTRIINSYDTTEHELSITPEDLKVAAVDSSDFYWSEYRNVQDFNISGDDFVFETTVCNPYFHPQHSNNECIIIFVGEFGRISLLFQDASRTYFGGIIFSEKELNGKNNNLSMFGVDITKPSKIKLINNNKNASVYFNDSSIYNIEYQNSIGNLKSIIYSFAGKGTVSSINLRNPTNTVQHKL